MAKQVCVHLLIACIMLVSIQFGQDTSNRALETPQCESHLKYRVDPAAAPKSAKISECPEEWYPVTSAPISAEVHAALDTS